MAKDQDELLAMEEASLQPGNLTLPPVGELNRLLMMRSMGLQFIYNLKSPSESRAYLQHFYQLANTGVSRR